MDTRTPTAEVFVLIKAACTKYSHEHFAQPWDNATTIDAVFAAAFSEPFSSTMESWISWATTWNAAKIQYAARGGSYTELPAFYKKHSVDSHK